ncbi:hypothetical protein X770_30670 [Mesorhizobium sp. LSJC269B00]|nr:hypothetical protein X770_30670 [Mesorhizobium sp. LSJC269B00]
MGRRRPETNPPTATCKPPPAITTDHRRHPTRLVKMHPEGGQIADAGRRKLIAVHQGG